MTTKRHPLQRARGKYPEELMEAIGGLGRRSQQRRPEREGCLGPGVIFRGKVAVGD